MPSVCFRCRLVRLEQPLRQLFDEARILSRLGLGLRGLYQDLTEEPVPDFLALFIRELEDREQRASR